MDLQPYSHDCFSKILRTLFDFLNNTYWVSFILEKQLANIPDRGFLFLRNTLLLYSLSHYRQTERQTESQIHSLHVGWRNLVTFLFWREIGFGFTYSLCTQSTIQLWCCVSFFQSGGQQFLVCMYLVYNTVVRLCHFCCCGGKANLV